MSIHPRLHLYNIPFRAMDKRLYILHSVLATDHKMIPLKSDVKNQWVYQGSLREHQRLKGIKEPNPVLKPRSFRALRQLEEPETEPRKHCCCSSHLGEELRGTCFFKDILSPLCFFFHFLNLMSPLFPSRRKYFS